MDYPVDILSSVPSTPATTQGVNAAYQAKFWTLVTVLKETTGTVLMSSKPSRSVTSGQGMLLPVDQPVGPFLIGPGSALYFVTSNSNTLERVSIIAQVVPKEDVGKIIKGMGC